MASVLVLGSSGMVGGAVVAHLRELGTVEVQCANRSGDGDAIVLDALEPPPLDSLLAGIDLVVNAIGTLRNHPDYPSDAYRLRATRVNSIFPLLLASAACRVGSRIVHVSSDAVFGPSQELKDETTAVSPFEPYGLTKALGEAEHEQVINVRCSVIGPAPGRSDGLWEWFVNQPPGGEVRGFTGRLWTGVTSRQLAVLCGDLIDPGAFERVRSVGPRHHFVPNEPITKLELLRMLRITLRPDINVIPDAADGPPGCQLTSRTRALDEVFSGSRGWQAAVREAAETAR